MNIAQDEIIAQIGEAKRFRSPYAKKKALLLKQIKEINRDIKRYDNIILRLSDELTGGKK